MLHNVCAYIESGKLQWQPWNKQYTHLSWKNKAPLEAKSLTTHTWTNGVMAQHTMYNVQGLR